MTGAAGSLAKLRAIGRTADPRFHRRVALLVAGSVAAGLIEAISIGSVVPLVTSASGMGDGALMSRFPAMGADPVRWALLFAALITVAAAARLLLARFAQEQVLMAGHRVAVAVHERVLGQPYAYHVRHHSSALIAAMDKVDLAINGVGWALVQAVAAALIGGAILLLLVGTQPLAALVAVAILGGLYFIFSRLFARSLSLHGDAINAAFERRIRLLQDSSGAIRDLLVSRRQSWFVDAFADASRSLAAARVGTDMLGHAPRFIVEALGAILFAGLAMISARQVGGLAASLPMLALFGLAFVRLLPLAHQLFRGWANLSASGAVIGDVADLLALPHAEQTREMPLPFADAIAVHDLCFAYPEGGAVLRGVNLSIGKGDWIGLTGPTGGGKSTLGDLLVGLLEASEGHITIDGALLAGDNVEAWQRQVALVSQSVFIADGSITSNVAFAEIGKPDAKRLAAACRIAQLDEWIGELGDGLDAKVGESGRRISGGQRQRIGIARALYGDAAFLLLDEATNALDHATEAAFLAELRAAQPKLTVMIISHREAALAACNRIFRVEDGQVTAC